MAFATNSNAVPSFTERLSSTFNTRGSRFTTTSAAVLLVSPAGLLTETEYDPASSAEAFDTAKAAVVPPTIRLESLYHWYLSTGEPVAVTLSAMGTPSFAVTFAGCLVICTGVSKASAAAVLVTLPAGLVTFTE